MLFKTVSTMNQDGQSNVDIVDKMFLTFRIIVDLVTLYAFNDVRLGKEDFIGGKIANNVWLCSGVYCHLVVLHNIIQLKC